MAITTMPIGFAINGDEYYVNLIKGQTYTFLITSTGLIVDGIPAISPVYTYDGDGVFLGFANTEGATTPDEGNAVGDTFNITATGPEVRYLGYTVAVTQERPKFFFGNLKIADMHFGSRHVIKAYFGNSLIWEREVPVPENALLAQDGKLFANGGGYLITTEVTLITFTFSGTTYQAEEGMTWGEWVASEYNTNGFTQRGYGIYGPGGEEIRDAQHSVVMESAKIVANATYISGGSND